MMNFAITSVALMQHAYECGLNKTEYRHRDAFSNMVHDGDNDTIVFMVEASAILISQFRSSRGYKDILLSICAFYHSTTGKSVTGSLLRSFNGLARELFVTAPFFQNDSGQQDWLAVLDGLHQNAHRVVKSPLGDKIAKVVNHVVARSVYTKLGIEFDAGFFGKLEAVHIRPTIWSVTSFVDAIVGLVIFLCKAGRHAMLTGSLECFFCDEVSIAQWLDKACELRKDAEFLKAPDVLSISLPQYIDEIKVAINDGKQLLKMFKSGREHHTILNVTLELGLVLKRHQADLMASSFRRAPIGIFIYGGSSIGKSTIATGLFNHYCSVRGITDSKAVLWTRTENDDYYSGYQSHFAGVLHDDAAKYRAAKVQGIDTSFADIISEINNVQFVTPQAALEDKGKIPFRSEWVGVSSNVPDLTAGLYFNCPAAFFRRFAVRITPVVKPEFRVDGEDKINTDFFEEGVQYPNLWNFTVDKPVVTGSEGRFERVGIFENYSDLLKYLTTVYEKHIAQQNSLMATVAKIGPEELCVCRVPKSICVCARPNTSVIADEPLSDDDGYFASGESSDSELDDSVNVQSHFVSCTDRRHRNRVTALTRSVTKFTMAQSKDVDTRRCVRKLLSAPHLQKLLDPTYCTDVPVDKLVSDVEEELSIAAQSFSQMSAREKLNWLGQECTQQLIGECFDFITFEPQIGSPGFFNPQHYDIIVDEIKRFYGVMTVAEERALEMFACGHLADFISKGWLYGDLVTAGIDYVKKRAPELEKDDERETVRRYLTSGRDRKWYHGAIVSIFKWYFSSSSFRCFIGLVAAIPGVWRFVGWIVRRNCTIRALLTGAAAQYDANLGGDNKFVRSVLAMGTLAATALLVYRIFHKDEDLVSGTVPSYATKFATLGDSVPISDVPLGTCDLVPSSADPTGPELDPQPHDQTDDYAAEYSIDHPEFKKPFPHDFAPTRELSAKLDPAAVQMDLHRVGTLPKPRAYERKNVWMVPERNITPLDVDPKRPHDLGQMAAAIKNNIVYAEVRGDFPQGKGTTRTRVLVIDSETFVINNHALPHGCSITMWLGPRTEVGPQPSIEFLPDEHYTKRDPLRDLAIVNTKAMPHRFKDIKHLFARSTYSAVGQSYLLIKQANGTIVKNPIHGVHQTKLRNMVGAEAVDTVAWCGEPFNVTKFGDCGSPLVIENALGCVIVGIHAGYRHDTNTAYSVRVSREDFDERQLPQVGVTNVHYALAQSEFVRLGPNDKLYTDFHKDGNIMTHGQLRTFIARPKFTGRKTPHAAFLFEKGAKLNPPILDCMAAPRVCGWEQPQKVLINYLKPTHSIVERAFRACGAAYADHVMSNLSDDDRADLHPVPIDVAVNGFPGVPNMDAQKHTTSAGHGRRGPKLRYMTEAEKNGVWDSYRMYRDDVIQEIDAMRENLAKGIRPHAIYDACFKDELLSRAKVEAGKARAIYMCPVAFLVNMRMSTMGICRVMIRRKYVFGCAIGLNTHSEEWDESFQRCQELPGDNWIASDFQAFESVLSLLISNVVSWVFTEVCRRGGNYDPQELLILTTLLADISNATINFFGELITLLGGEASGQQMTTPFNCVANVLLHMYAFVIIACGVHATYDEYFDMAKKFFTLVRILTLGDDVYMKVHPDETWFNHTSIQEVFASIGITYTMADKLAASRPYVSHKEVTFLKRSFVDHEEFPGMKVAALEKKSIYKMLCYTVPSKSVSNEEQWAAAIASAYAEAFFHGREFFDHIDVLVKHMPKSRELELRIAQNPPPGWGEMVVRFLKSSPRTRAMRSAPEVSETVQPKHSYCLWTDLELQSEWSVDAWGSTDVVHSPRGIYRRLPWPKNVPSRQCVETGLYDESQGFSKNYNRENKNTKPPRCDREMTPDAVEKVINKLHSKRRRDKKRRQWQGAMVQSEFLPDTKLDVALQEHQDVVQQTTEFVNEPVGVRIKIGDNLDGVAGSMSMSQDLGSYLSRPRLISTYTWQENSVSGLKTTLYPWELYFGDVNMVDKLRGFSLLRAKLHIKALINGSPFYYGSLCAVYTPLDGWRRDTANTPDLSMKLITSSQKPHMWLDNQNCSTAQMELPFIFPYPYLDFSQKSMLRSMGKLELIQYAPLLSANGVSGNNIDVQVYAWAEDVQLSGPTNMPIAQSEYVGDTQLSTVASTVANVAGRLDKVPIIGPYAKATEMAASAVGSVANFFGFTNVPNVSDVAPMKPMVFQLASTELSEPTQKLSLQTKQETAIGQQLHGGTAEDDMVIGRFAGRSSYLTSSIWSTTNVPGDSLFACPVVPNLFGRSDTQIAFTPMGWLANHFQYWRGPIKYTFRVVRSPFHRGRLQISWDSRTGVLNQGPVLGNPNTITKIMDLDGEDEISFVVPYMQPELFQTMPEYLDGDTIPNPVFSVDSSPPATLFPLANGVINVRVMNRLTAPEASSGVTLLVFVSAAEGFEFAGPAQFNVVSKNNDSIWYTLFDSNQAVAQSDTTYDDAKPSGTITSDGTSDVIYQHVFGERLTSLRELLHRSSLAYQYTPRQFNLLITQGTAQVNVPIKRLPPWPGVSLNGWYTCTFAGNAARCFYSKFHPLNSIGACFLGYKGSVNVTLNLDQTRASGPCDTLQVRRLSRGDRLQDQERRPNLVFYANESLTTSASGRADNAIIRSGIEGMALTNTRTNAGISVQLPYYSSASFQLMDSNSEHTNADLLTDRDNDWWQVEWRVNKSNTAGWFVGNNLQTYYSSGPDFDLFFFINVPILTKIQVTD